ncbi:MAG: M20 metallopeptidase family protein [Candidatus Limnocylindrales bacterium]
MGATGIDPTALRDAAEAILLDVVAIRRRLHRRPEIGLQLPETQTLIVEELRRLGLEARPGGSTTSVTAVIDGAHPGPTTLLRADMDALPVGEDTGLDFASEVAGTMHACGHDTHVAMLLGAARLLVDRRADLRGRVLLMFQPGEEGFHGARFMLEEGLLEEGPHGAGDVARAVALHISTRYASGVVALRPGAMLASADRIIATIHGRGGHASAPHLALDPVPVTAELILALQSMITRRVDAFDPAVLTITRLAGGTTNNIIPASVEIEGTIRTVSETVRASVAGWVHQVADGVAAAHGARIDLEIVPGYPVTMNDPAVTAWVRELAVNVAGEALVEDLAAPIMGAEDFSYVLQRVPGMMAFIGARPAHEDPAPAPQNHSNLVIFEEAPMATGVALYAAAALAG